MPVLLCIVMAAVTVVMTVFRVMLTGLIMHRKNTVAVRSWDMASFRASVRRGMLGCYPSFLRRSMPSAHGDWHLHYGKHDRSRQGLALGYQQKAGIEKTTKTVYVRHHRPACHR